MDGVISFVWEQETFRLNIKTDCSEDYRITCIAKIYTDIALEKNCQYQCIS